LLRTYIVFHDCTHGSFLPSKRANAWVGTALGLVVHSSFRSWGHEHRVHHATPGDLDRRGVGDVNTLTVAEYGRLAWPRRLGYRLFRNPLVMFGVGPISAMLIKPGQANESASPLLARTLGCAQGHGWRGRHIEDAVVVGGALDSSQYWKDAAWATNHAPIPTFRTGEVKDGEAHDRLGLRSRPHP